MSNKWKERAVCLTCDEPIRFSKSRKIWFTYHGRPTCINGKAHSPTNS